MKRIGVDVGGTFTDVVGVEKGKIISYKVHSTPDNPATGVGDGLEVFLSSDSEGFEVGHIHHGTTVGTNALLESETAETALITTEGFRDVLEIGRQDRPQLYDLDFSRPSPVIPRSLRFTVPERIGPGGEVVRSLDKAELKKVVESIPDPVEAVAVSTLFSFANPVHEKKIKKYLVNNGFGVTLSSEVLPEPREYERTSTTAINASLKPVFRDYLGQLESRAEDLDLESDWLVMQSNGGLIEPDIAKREPVRTILSGPAGGVEGAQFIAGSAGYEDVLTLDMGGTSADVCLIKDGEASVTTDWSIDDHPVGVSSLDVHTIGAGGGSIAWMDEGGALRVGPGSAGADPGPVCYSRGGEEPTVTDAHLVLGRLDPDFPLADSLELERGAARKAISEKIGAPLDLGPREAAQGILDVANSNMKRALRLVSVQQGHDPRTFALLAYGGAGPLHAARLAKEMSIPRVIIPPAAGVLSSLGLLASDTRQEFVSSVLRNSEAIEPEEIRAEWEEMSKKASPSLTEGKVDHRPYLDIRYSGQSYHLRVPVSKVQLNRSGLDEAIEEFHGVHERKYGHSKTDEPVEVVSQRLEFIGKIDDLSLSGDLSGDGEAYLGDRDVIFSGESEKTKIFRYENLGVGDSVSGPAILHSRDSTIVVHPGQSAELNGDGALIIEV
ncbi:hydantoinase/oxoprolinase family protein [Candidatus Bipolaricaulota bacterium]|nr:hydantoinase/oxoprolinase family protein [Candidatus Bipolaricaulota bacterium]